jgi:C_GCAxxG_C_C family probable redox protein
MADETGFVMFKLTASGYCCSQVMMKMALDAEEKENKDLMRAVSGLCLGAGSYQRTCGALTGGIAILGLYAGKGYDVEYPKPCYSKMADEYTDWFAAELGSTECKDIIGVCSVTDYQTNQSYRLKCGDVLVKGYRKIQEILQEHEFEFGTRDE